MLQVRKVCPPARAREPRCEGRAIDFFLASLCFILPSVIDGSDFENGSLPQKNDVTRVTQTTIDVS